MADITELREALTDLEVPNRSIDEPLSAPDLFHKKLRRFPEEIYNVHTDSHLYRFLLALCGEGGAGSLKKELLYSKLQSSIFATHFHDLDRLYGDPLGLPRIDIEVYAFDPRDEVLTVQEWMEVYAKDANYRNRCLIWMRAIMHGPSPMGIRLAAEAACGIECDIFQVADYLEDTRSDHPKGISNIGQTAADREVVIVPRINALTQSQRHRIISMVDRIRPVDSLITVALGTSPRTQKFPASSAATSEFTQIKRMVRGRDDIVWPDIGRRAARNIIANGGAEFNTIYTGSNSGTLTRTNTEVPAKFGSYVFKGVAAAAPGGNNHLHDTYPLEVKNSVPNGLTAGSKWVGSVWVRGTGTSIGRKVELLMSEVGGANGEETTGSTSPMPSITLTNYWQRISTNLTMNRNDRTTARLYILNTGLDNTAAGMIIYWDGVQIELGSTPTPYIPTVTPYGGASAPAQDNQGLWLVSGEEREAPTYAWINRQESATFLDIINVDASSEHYGSHNLTERQLFPHLATEPDDPFFRYGGELSFSESFAQIGLSVPWQRNDQVIVNNFYPLDYLQEVDHLASFNVTSPSHHFWSSEEKNPDRPVTNLEPYPDGEDGVQFWGNDYGYVWRDNNVKLFGKASMRFQRTDGSGSGIVDHYRPTPSTPAIPGTQYCYSIYVRHHDPNFPPRSFQVFLQWFDSFNVNFASTPAGAAVTTLKGDWVRVTVSGVAPANSVFVRPVLQSEVVGETERFYANAALLETGVDTPSPYPQDEEWLEFDLGRNRPFNYVDFEISHKPVDISVQYKIEDTNILAAFQDPGFEDVIGYKPNIRPDGYGWWYYYAEGPPDVIGTQGTISTDTEVFNPNGSGKASAKVVIYNTAAGNTNSQGIAYSNAPVVASQYYKFGLWHKGGKGRLFSLLISPYAGFNASGPTGALGTEYFAGTDEWEYHEVYILTPPGTNYVYLYCIADPLNGLGAGTFWVDDASFTQTNAVSPVNNWTDITPTDGVEYTDEISYIVADQPWRFWRAYFDTVNARRLRVKFNRREDPFPFSDSDLFPWSVDVRNFRAVHLYQQSTDFIADSGRDIIGNTFRNVQHTFPSTAAHDAKDDTFWMSQPNPTSTAVEALYFDVSTSTHSVTMSELDTGLGGGGNTMTDYDTNSMSSMESYIGGTGTQTVDEIFIDPVIAGCDMHFYWSTDPQPDWESKLWHPVPKHYKCTRGFHAFPYPVTCRYFKVEFSNLTPIPYNTLDYPQLSPPLYRKFPSWVQNYFAALTPEVIASFLEDSQTITIDPYTLFHLQEDLLATSRDAQVLPREEPEEDDVNEIHDIIDEIVNFEDETTILEEEAKIRFFPPTIWQDDLKNVLDLNRAASRIIWQDSEQQFMIEDAPEILDAPDEQSADDLSAERTLKTLPIMWFPRICRHGYQVVTGPFQAKIAYQVSIREITFWYRGWAAAGKSAYGSSTYGESYYGSTFG